MDSIKVSWSALSAWSAGRKDDAAKMLAGVDIAGNAAMARGKKIHETISKHKLPLIPEVANGAIFEDMENGINAWTGENAIQINDWLRLSLIIDVLDPVEGVIVDWKASRLRSSEHNKMQIYLYALAMNKLGFDINYGIFATVDEAQSDGGIFCRDYTLFKINEEKLELAENYLETVGGVIYEFLKT